MKDWKDEFDLEFGNLFEFDEQSSDMKTVKPDQIKDFIEKLLVAERKKVLEEIKKLREPIDNSRKDIAGVYYEGWKKYNQALDDVLSQLKER